MRELKKSTFVVRLSETHDARILFLCINPKTISLHVSDFQILVLTADKKNWWYSLTSNRKVYRKKYMHLLV